MTRMNYLENAILNVNNAELDDTLPLKQRFEFDSEEGIYSTMWTSHYM